MRALCQVVSHDYQIKRELRQYVLCDVMAPLSKLGEEGGRFTVTMSDEYCLIVDCVTALASGETQSL